MTNVESVTKRSILIFTDWYYPGYKAGGPIQSVYNLAALLCESYDVKIVCRNKDIDADEGYPNIKYNIWTSILENQKIMYLDAQGQSFRNIKQIVKENRNNVLYINGIYSIKFSVLPLFFGNYFDVKKCFVSVRGMLHQSALSVKPLKKQVFLAFARGFGLYSKSVLLASSESEKNEIKRVLKGVSIKIVPNIPVLLSEKGNQNTKNKVCKFLFLGRISPEKNPLALLDALQNIDHTCEVTFCGSAINKAYFKEFEEKLKALPKHISSQYIEEMPHDDIAALIKSHDVMVLPSLGENFGHAIFESFIQSKPVIIGNNTPWKNIEEKHAGLEIEATNTLALTRALERFIEMDASTYSVWCEGARSIAEAYYQENNFKETYFQLFS